MTMSRGRGQHAGLSRQGILRAAVRLADREGLAALSMRRLGAELGVEAMAVYHYFPNKAALLDGIVEEVAAEVPMSRFDDSDWREGFRAYARALLDTLVGHPNLVPLAFSRPATTPRNLRAMESLLRWLGTAGFEPRTALDMVYAVNGLTLVHAVLQTGAGGAPAPHGESGQTSRLAELPAETYPLMAEAARSSATRGPTARFEFALDALLTGFAAARNPS